MVVTQADKLNTTVRIEKRHTTVMIEYNKKMENISNDQTTYKILNNNPTKTVRNSIFRLLKKWTKLNYTQKKWIFTKETNLAKAYRQVKTHKPGLPLRIVISCIDSPLRQLSDFYKEILTKACKNPQYIIKNSIDFEEKVQNILIPKNSLMDSLDVVSLYLSVPYELVKESIKKGGQTWKNVLKCPL